MNQFLQNVRSNDTLTENMAVAHSTTGSDLADQFAKAGSHRDRSISQVFVEQGALDAKYGKWALRFVFYLRLITRIIRFFDGTKSETVQKGQGARDESFKRYLWYAQNKPNLFYTNLSTFVECGSHKDVFELLWYAKKFAIKVDEKRVLMEIIVSMDGGLYSDDLLLKYLPLQKAQAKLTTDRAKYRNYLAGLIQNYSGLTSKELRQLKVSGKAHTWQQLISRKLFEEINFKLISGKALLKMAAGKFLKNHNLVEKYTVWIMKQPVAKFTGYVFELGAKVVDNMAPHLKMTIDKQFEGLLQLGKMKTTRKVICAVDRSGSMETKVANTKAMNIAESLGIYFSNLLEGEFHKWVIRFSKRSKWIQLKGTFSEQKLQMTWDDCPSNTDFQSIIDSFVRVKLQHPLTPESDFPDTLLVVSDMQFDNPGWGWPAMNIKTNYQVAIQKLSQVFSPEYCANFVFIWWDCTGRVPQNQPQNIFEPGGYFVSGFDGSVLDILLGSVEKKESVEKSIEEILSQEVLERIIY